MPPEVNSPMETSINAYPLEDQQLERTSDWSEKKIDSFKLRIVRFPWASNLITPSPSNKDPSDVYPPAFNLLVSYPSDKRAYADLEASQKPFYNRLKLLRRWPHCPGVNIAYFLLTHTGFEDEPIHFLSQAKFKTKISGKTVISDASYVVIGQLLSLIYMVVIEDTCGIETFEKRKYQMAGDMMVAATIRHTVFSQHDCFPASTRMFGMLIWESNVSFYQANFTHEAIMKRQCGDPTFSQSTFYEHYEVSEDPSISTKLSLLDLEGRRSIASTLLCIRREILFMTSDR